MSLKYKILAICFFIDYSKHKTVNKATSRKPSANPGWPCAHLLKSFPVVIFFRLSGFPNSFDKVFLINFLISFPNLIFQWSFKNSIVNKTVISFVTREIITVKFFCKLNFSFHKNSKKTRKRSWHYLCFFVVKNMFGWFIETYLQ